MASFAPKGTRIDGNGIYLRVLEESDASARYAGWLNDPEVTRHLDSCGGTLESVKEYIAGKSTSEISVFFGIFLSRKDRHIGNVKLEPVDLVILN